MDAFATYDDLGKLLNRTFTVGVEAAWITTLLESASTYLREDVIGQQVYPQATSTFAAWPDTTGTVALPQFPVVSVASVTLGGAPIWFRWVDDRVETRQQERVEVTFTYGYALAPEGLKRWACVLVSQALQLLENELGLSIGGLSSVSIDDFKLAFANAGEDTGMTLSARNIALIRRQFSTGDVHVSDTRP
ncbi:hypothetical protein [Glaciibacter psychrotolerans]|uniref:Phage gp6-like head-tail connector protein n=1 Tax=Glaciibacter psychrotolerans TaxID=670054 RepID=A0A7Z0ECK6_9MICO|nr:hypothetical protein [Leifsonia psychrotolerans]NYJ19197.1 hypothetical protein [Leifsonia psychrotolerans]